METGRSNEKREFWKPEPRTFSVFDKGIWAKEPKGVMDPYSVYVYIRDGVAREQTERLRTIMDAQGMRLYKCTEFESAVFSGVFKSLEDEAPTRPSGYVCFDFNHVSVQDTKDILMGVEEYETVLLFTSPTGHGVKWVVNNNTVFNHEQFYKVVHDYLWKTYGLEASMEAGDIRHRCFLPWDPEVYINPNYM